MTAATRMPVQFVPQVRPSCPRDFTINAMAYAPGEGLIDLYGGRSDLHACLMRCVGDPEERFAEDALRILRAVRLAAQLDFALRKPPSAPRWTCGSCIPEYFRRAHLYRAR